MAKIAFLECSKCRHQLSAETPQTLCTICQGSLYARYDLKALRGRFRTEMLAGRPATMWRYAEVLPDAIRLATEKVTRENHTREELLRGAYLRDVYEKYGVL